MTREWDATSYHKVSGPQTGWGQKVLARLELAGDERVIDAGCGSGRLTGELAERLPHGQVVALDRSWNMLQTARANLRPTYGSRVRFVQVSLPALPFEECADVVFSTATFHWVADHPALFSNIFEALRPGGRLHAQCGGGPNLALGTCPGRSGDGGGAVRSILPRLARRLAIRLRRRDPHAAGRRRASSTWSPASRRRRPASRRRRTIASSSPPSSIIRTSHGCLRTAAAAVHRRGHQARRPSSPSPSPWTTGA